MIKTSFAPTNFLANSDFFAALISNSNDLNLKDLTIDQKKSIDIQIVKANVERTQPYKFTIEFDAIRKDDNKDVTVKVDVTRYLPNNNLCPIDYEFTIEEK